MLITKVNIITQILLNLILSFMVFFNGPIFVFLIPWLPGYYLIAELGVFVLEAKIYHDKLADKEARRQPIRYALAANLVSFILGLLLETFVPFIF